MFNWVTFVLMRIGRYFFSLTERKFKKKRNKFRKFVYYLPNATYRRNGRTYF